MCFKIIIPVTDSYYDINDYIPYSVHYISMTFTNFVTRSLYFLMFLTYFNYPSVLLPSGNDQFVLCIYMFACFAVFVHLFCFSDSMYKWNHTVFFFTWLISFSIIASRSIHFVTDGRISFFYMAELFSVIYICVCVYVCMCIHTHIYILGFSGGSDGKESACSAGDGGSIPGLGRSPGQPTAVFLLGESPLTEEPGRLQSMGLQRHDWATKHIHMCVCVCICMYMSHIHTPHLYPFICWWVLKYLLSWLGNCKQCYNKRGAFWGNYFCFLWKNTWSRFAGSCGSIIFNFLENSCTGFHSDFTNLLSQHQSAMNSLFFTFLPALTCCLFDNSHSDRCKDISLRF